MSKPSNTDKKEKLAEFYANGMKVKEISEQLKVSPSTIRRWIKEILSFQSTAEVSQNDESSELEENIVENQDEELLPLALQSLKGLLEKGSPTSKLGAARLVVQLHKLSQVGKDKGVTMNEAVFEAATQMLVELFRRRDDLKKEALIELEKIHIAETDALEVSENEAGTAG